jgi:hypothetical protein
LVPLQTISNSQITPLIDCIGGGGALPINNHLTPNLFCYKRLRATQPPTPSNNHHTSSSPSNPLLLGCLPPPNQALAIVNRSIYSQQPILPRSYYRLR